jgi:hypothetical protein
MTAVAMTGADTIQINNYNFVDLADGDIAVLTFPNDIAAVKTGKNGNSIYALNETGNNAEFKLKVLRGSADDAFLLGLLNNQLLNFAGFPLMIGQFVKRVGDGKGNITSDIYNVQGGVFTKIPEAKSNVEGDIDQSTTTYTIKFANVPRVLS